MAKWKVQTIYHEVFKHTVEADSKEQAEKLGLGFSCEDWAESRDYYWYASFAERIEEDVVTEGI